MSFIKAWERTKEFEKGYVDNPKDAGGPTNHGITEAIARASGFTGDMKDLTPAQAMEIGKKQFWDTLGLDAVDLLSEPIAQELFDTGMNCGQAEAGKFLQRSLNGFNRQQRDYQDVPIDGIVGPMTVAALRHFLLKRTTTGETVMLRALNSLQGAYYLAITGSRPANEEFVYGWFLNRVQI